MTLIDTEPRYADATGLPVYIVDQVQRRYLGDGLASVINCRTINGIITPVCEIIVSTQRLLPIGRASVAFAAEMWQRHQTEMLEALGRGH